MQAAHVFLLKTLGEAPTVEQVSANRKFLHAPETQIEKKIWTAFLFGLHTARADNVAEDAGVRNGSWVEGWLYSGDGGKGGKTTDIVQAAQAT